MVGTSNSIAASACAGENKGSETCVLGERIVRVEKWADDVAGDGGRSGAKLGRGCSGMDLVRASDR